MPLMLLAVDSASQSAGGNATVPLWIWVVFVAAVMALLVVDLLVFQRDPHRVETREAAIWSAIWIGLGLAFSGVVYIMFDGPTVIDYLTGYLIEKSLSVDNLFVFVIIFSYFGVPPKYQHRVLFWGIFGALVFRGLFIFAGVALLNKFSWIAYVFGVFLVYTGYKLGSHGGVEVHPENNVVLNVLRKYLPVTNDLHEEKLFVKKGGHRVATRLFATLVVIETTDVIFAVDSIPAILAITTNTFIVFSSNAFALLGLRALYFLLADLVARFRYLDLGLAVILALVGVKMVVEEADLLHIPSWGPLVLVTVIITTAVVASIRHPEPDEAVAQNTADAEGDVPPDGDEASTARPDS